MDAPAELDLNEPVLVRATIAFGGLQVGQVVTVDRRDPEIARYLAAQFLIPESADYAEPPAAGVEIEGEEE